MEERKTQRVGNAVIGFKDIQRYKYRCKRENKQIPTQLLVFERLLRLADEYKIIEVKVHTEQ